MTLDQIVDLLRTHGRKAGIRDMHTHCLCGWTSTGPNGPGEHLKHQAATILAATNLGRKITPLDCGICIRDDSTQDQITIVHFAHCPHHGQY